ALVAVVIGLRLLEGRLAFSTAFFILLLLPEFYRPLRQSGAVFHTLMNVNTAAAEIETYLAAADAPPALNGHKASLQVPPAIRLANITFTYPKRHSPTLQNLNLTFPAGQITLLTGNSGCGKSTLLDILACLQPPDSGTIYLNDQCLLTMHPDSQQKLIAYAPQTPHLYQGSLQENLLLLQQAPPERCHQALRLAQLTEWFSTLPQGLDTPLGAGGQPLSQGQLKRLGLARLILQNSPIMLLDEPTSGLDRQLEEKIIRTLSVLAKQRTLIISSHHPALLELADNIIDLNDYLPKEA
ncbi:MAG: ATP-binding cassette domain-containing protein, partial [Selenomonas sp.]|nr:ATP-binding cassette domain-containing protein [Selenomonas sp.]